MTATVRVAEPACSPAQWLDHIDEACVVLDRSFRVVYCNGAFARPLGLAPGALIGKPLGHTLPAFAGSPFERLCQRVFATGARAEAETETAGRFFHQRAFPVEPDGVLVLASDITLRRQLEDDLLQTALRSRLILDQLPAVQWTVDRDLRFIVSTGAGLAKLGLVPGQVEGMTLYDYLQTNDPAHVSISAHLRALAGERVPHSIEHAGRCFDCVVEPLRDAHNQVIGVVGVAHDVTERHRAEQERHRLQGLMTQAQKLESLGLLAGGVAHDFNNILVGILGIADLLRAELPPDSPHRHLAETLKVAGERAADLTRQMLVYAGRGRASRRAVDLNRLVRENLPLLAAALSKNITVHTDLETDLPPLHADAGQVQQVVMNLLLNAAEAIGGNGLGGPQGQPEGQITVVTRKRNLTAVDRIETPSGQALVPGQYVQVEVADTGCGMTPEVMRRIFDPFFTTKVTGRGLGLSAVLGIVETHRGAIQVETAPGAGTRFRVLLPTAAPEPVKAPSLPGGLSLPPAVVLIIDDEAVLRDVARRALTAAGIRVLEAGDGREGLELFREHRDEVSLVLLDRVMPGVDSAEVLATIKRMRPDVKVILTSGYDQSEAASRIDERALAGFLQKPYTLHALLEAVTGALR